MNYKTLIDQMSIEEKASLMSGKDFWQTKNIDKHNIPSIFLADGPNGLRKQKAAADHLGLNESVKSTCYPTSATIANSWNPILVEKVGSMLGIEAVEEKVSVVLGPGVNIKRNPLGGRNFEYYSEDPYLSGKLAAGFIRGVQSLGIATSVKHFAANNQEYRRMSIDSVIDERTLREIYLTAFEIAIKEGNSKAVMASYNLLNGIYANENIHLLKDILRDEWKFDGIVVSDWGGINDRVAGLIASSELEMPFSGGETDDEIVRAVKSGSLDVKVLDEAVDRLLSLIYSTHDSIQKSNVKMNVEEHHKIAQLAAEESLVLLKNENNCLPLKGKKIAIIGDFAKHQRFQGAGSSGVNPTKLETVLDCVHDADFSFVGYEKGFDRFGKKNSRLIKQALELAKKAETVVLFLGLDEDSESEGLDRINLSLPQNQIDLLEAIHPYHKQIVVVLSCGSVVDMKWDVHAQAVLHSYLPGQAGARAILNVLSGAVCPSGKLAETYPFEYSDVPSANYFPGKENTVEYRESIYVGYRYFDNYLLKVKYPFGYGLSYAKFAYKTIKVSAEGVQFKITNESLVEAKEIAQLYIGLKKTGILRPKKELKGFIKETFAPKETKTLFIPFDEYTFRYYNERTHRWEIEQGDYDVYIGASSVDIRLQGSVHQEATTEIMPYDLNALPNYRNLQIHTIPNEEFERLINRPLPDSHFVFYKKNRMIVNYNTTVQQLRYSKGWTGRIFAWGVRFGYSFLRFIGNRKTANVLQMALYHNPMRNISRLIGGAITWGQLDGMILMFNGHFFKGFKQFLKMGKKR